MSDVLYAGAMASTLEYPEGDHVVETIADVPIALKAVLMVDRLPSVLPQPPARRERQAWGVPLTVDGQHIESFSGVPFSAALLDFVRKAWPGVGWVLGNPRSVSWQALYGYVGKRLVAVVSQRRAVAHAP